MAEGREFLARSPVAPFRLVAEREKRLAAACLGAGLRDRKHLLGTEISALARHAADARTCSSGRSCDKAW